MKKLLLIIAILFSGITSSYASHLMAGEITYTHISGDDYEVTLVIYGDCDPSSIDVSQTQTVSFESASCGQNFNFTIPYIGLEADSISPACPTAVSTCAGGTVPGAFKHVFRGIVTLTPCSDWVIYWTSGTRNPAITNLVSPDSENLFIRTRLNNILGAFNNSPQYGAAPTPYMCINNLKIFNHGATDIDGDSLYYTFNQPLGTPGPPGTPIAFAGGYSLLQPMITTAGMNLDQETGEMCFTPSQAQVAVVSVLIEEFRNGVLIADQIREMQVTAVACTPSNGSPTTGSTAATCGGSGGMTIPSSGASVDSLDQNSLIMCPDDNVCINIVTSDPDGNNITVTSNVLTAIPTATFTVTNNGTPNPIIDFCWTPTALDSGLNVFTVTLRDDACPISAEQTFAYDITVYDEPYAGADQIICGAQSAQLNATGGATYTWFDAVTNIQVPVGPAFSCNPCFNPIATPATTTDYYVLSSLTAACENTDTVRVTVVSDFTPDAIGDTTLCDFLNRQLDVNIVSGPAGVYTYLWNNGATLSNINIQNPIASPVDSTWYVVEVTSPDGCAKTVDSVLVGVVIPANVQLTPDDSTICVGESLNFDVKSTCLYTLRMLDTFGDGWNGQSLDVYENGTLIGNYTVSPTDNNGDSLVVTFSVTNGSPLDVIYNTGSFQNESHYYLTDGTGALVSSFAPGAMTGLSTGDTLYTGLANCGPSLAAYTYVWSPGTGLSSTTIADPIFTSTVPTVSVPYTVTLTDPGSGCSFDRTQNITVATNSLFLPTLRDTFYCEGSSVDIDAGAFVTYQWNPTGGSGQFGTIDQPGPYSVTVSDGTCIGTSNTIDVTEIPTPQPEILGNLSICANETTTLSAAPVSPPYLSYSWDTGSTLDSTTVAATVGDVTLTVADSLGCLGSETVTISSLPIPSTVITGVTSICPGSTITLGTSGSFPFYEWSDGSINSSITIGGGPVSVTIRNSNGCEFTANATVNTYSTPVADFTINPEVSGEPNIDILFTNASTGASSWIWDFDVTNIGSTPSNETGVGPFNFVYENQGAYTVTLTVTNDDGCTNTITKEYLIFSEIGTPSIITPNGDGMNDNLVFSNLDPSLFPNQITVLNRWGRKVYEQDNYNNDWDGDNLKEGTYFYVLRVNFNTGEEVFKGSLTILR